MNTNVFTYRVVFNPYASVRLNILPKPGTLSLDGNGILTLTDTSNQEIIVQKPFGELAGVRPSQLIHFYKHASGTYSLILYVGKNEAYTIIFGSEDPVLNSGIDIYEKLLRGDRAAAVEEFKANDISHADKNKVKSATHQANDDYANFIAEAKRAGVYKAATSSAPFISGILIVVAVATIFIYVFLKIKQ